MGKEMSRIGSVPDMERLREAAMPALLAGFTEDPTLTWAIVGQSGDVYAFGIEDDRTEAELFCAPTQTRDEPLFLFGRPSTDEQENPGAIEQPIPGDDQHLYNFQVGKLGGMFASVPETITPVDPKDISKGVLHILTGEITDADTSA